MSSVAEQKNHLTTSKILSDTIVSFKDNSKLKIYIHQKTQNTKMFFTLGEIIAILKAIINWKNLYDDRNPAIILCSFELELALDCKALHVIEIKERVINQLAYVSDYSGKMKKLQ